MRSRFGEGSLLKSKLTLATHNCETLRDKARLTDKPFAISGHEHSLYRLFTNFTNFHFEFSFLYFSASSIRLNDSSDSDMVAIPITNG